MSTLVSRFAALIVFVSAPAYAHFKLDAPASWSAQNNLGDPQKAYPCGPAGSAEVQTGAVTTVTAGTSLTLTVNETIYHPGHYRVAIAQSQNLLPDDPPITKVGDDACGSTTIASNPTLPVLADGVLKHSSPFARPQTVQIPIPADLTCSNCVVQVIQYMSNHGAPCFYYHCAVVNVVAPGTVIDAGAGTVPDAGTGTVPDSGVSTPGTGSTVTDGGATPSELAESTGCGATNRGLLGAAALGLVLLLSKSRRRHSA